MGSVSCTDKELGVGSVGGAAISLRQCHNSFLKYAEEGETGPVPTVIMVPAEVFGSFQGRWLSQCS